MKRGLRPAGVDEAGRGPLAGPVVCAAVILAPRSRIAGLDDSKALCDWATLEKARIDAAIAASGQAN